MSHHCRPDGRLAVSLISEFLQKTPEFVIEVLLDLHHVPELRRNSP
ncbi:MAG: hypothetical protein ACI8P0_002882 [Planctomycetaceae bacterium]|jgi:hypothetical protein